MTVETMTLTDFLLARLDEDERYAEQHFTQYSRQILATVAAHRRILWMHATPWLGMDECGICVDEYGGTIQDDGPPHEPYPCPTLRALASVYADHPDYRDEWR
jgi:hypothetical protein